MIMKHLGLEEKKLELKKAIHTAREIEQQPDLWLEVYNLFVQNDKRIDAFLSFQLKGVNKILLSGAGTSAYIGLSLKGMFYRNTGIYTDAVPTTDLVTHPQDYVLPTDRVLLISFARSGNSPESCAAVSAVENFAKECTHLFITCNESGNLNLMNTKGDKYSFVLPERSNDLSLAMTSSYSSMLFAGILFAHYTSATRFGEPVKLLAKYGRRIIDEYNGLLKGIAEFPFERAVFLGSGAFFGMATEAHLKILELTNGKVNSRVESFLGFRHGPKVVVNDKTLLVCFLSSDEIVRKYELDLVHSIKDELDPLIAILVAEEFDGGDDLTDYVIRLKEDEAMLYEDFLPVCFILVAQLLSFHKSIALGLGPDNPSINGVIHRVVQGVEIYSK